jgi:hypothetical protein
MNKKIKIKADTRQFINQAWTRNGNDLTKVVTGEALILATLLHTHGSNRAGSDFKAVQALMDDVNLNDKE